LLNFLAKGTPVKKIFALTVLLLAGCAHKPATVDFLYKGMNKDMMLRIMGEPVQVITTYQDGESAKQYQFSNSQCEGGRKVICTVATTNEGVVYQWSGIRRALTEEGQK
jgi:hypothetical protein